MVFKSNSPIIPLFNPIDKQFELELVLIHFTEHGYIGKSELSF